MKKNVIAQTAAEGTVAEVQTGDITNTAYTFRPLNSTDTFLLFKIIGKVGVNEFSACFEKDSVKQMMSKSENATMVGISVMLEVANVIIANLPKCETEIYQLLSNVSNLSVEEVKGLGFATFAEMVLDFVKKDEFRDFIKVVSKSFKAAN